MILGLNNFEYKEHVVEGRDQLKTIH